MRILVILFAVVMNLVLADAVTKEFAECRLTSGDSFTVIPGFLDFIQVHNRGCAWGMFQGHVWPLAVFGILALIVLIWKRRSLFVSESPARTPFTLRLAEPLLYAGILGNVIDRVFRGTRLFDGYVVDMIDFHWRNVWHYPCFNLADVYICVAAGLLILASFREKKLDAGKKHS